MMGGKIHIIKSDKIDEIPLEIPLENLEQIYINK